MRTERSLDLAIILGKNSEKVIFQKLRGVGGRVQIVKVNQYKLIYPKCWIRERSRVQGR